MNEYLEHKNLEKMAKKKHIKFYRKYPITGIQRYSTSEVFDNIMLVVLMDSIFYRDNYETLKQMIENAKDGDKILLW